MQQGRPTLLPTKAIRILDLAPEDSSSNATGGSIGCANAESADQWDGLWDHGIAREDEIARWFVGVTELLNTQPYGR